MDSTITLSIVVMVMLIYMIIQLLKSLIIGPAFSILKWLIHGEDYIKWFKFKQTYIPPKKRTNFSKNKVEEKITK